MLKQINPAGKSDEYVSVDSYESSTKGIIAQMKGNLIWDRYTATKVYLDHFSGRS